MAETISYVALFTGIASIILAIIAIWLAIAFKKQSDDINRDTTQKLARIEAFASSTKEDAFAELSKWSEFVRKGGMKDLAEEETLRRLLKELTVTTRKEIDGGIAVVEERIEQSLTNVAKSSTLTEIKKDFQTLKDEMSKIHERNITQALEWRKQIRFEYWWRIYTAKQKGIVKVMLGNPKTSTADLEQMGYRALDALLVMATLGLTGLLSFDIEGTKWVFDDTVKGVL